jgi:heme A synthase
VVALHLVNTLLLTASATLTVVAAGRGENPHTSSSDGRVRAPLLVSVLIGLGLVAATGAVTALGDTLFPVPLPAGGGLSAAGSALRPAADHFLVQLRLLHPLLACGLVVAAVGLAQRLASVPSVRPFALLLGALALLQLVLGGVNILLRAPGWLQLAHLLVAQLLWISAVLAAQAFWRSGSPREPRPGWAR